MQDQNAAVKHVAYGRCRTVIASRTTGKCDLGILARAVRQRLFCADLDFDDIGGERFYRKNISSEPCCGREFVKGYLGVPTNASLTC